MRARLCPTFTPTLFSPRCGDPNKRANKGAPRGTAPTSGRGRQRARAVVARQLLEALAFRFWQEKKRHDGPEQAHGGGDQLRPSEPPGFHRERKEKDADESPKLARRCRNAVRCGAQVDREDFGWLPSRRLVWGSTDDERKSEFSSSRVDVTFRGARASGA